MYRLPTALKKELNWQTLSTEETGLVNLSSGPAWTQEKNTSFVRVVLISDQSQIKKLQFAFSDRVKVYLNNVIIYGGHDKFPSQDYRYLGIVGFFNELYLSLQPGRNELWIAVSEDFGTGE